MLLAPAQIRTSGCELAATHGDLAQRLDELEQKTEGLPMPHDTFSRNTCNQLKQVFDALRELVTPPDPPERPIGFFTPVDKSSKTASAQARRKGQCSPQSGVKPKT